MSAFAAKLKELTPNELQLVEQLKKEVAPTVQQHAHLQQFCNEWTYVRYLKSRNWNLAKASKMLQATLEWRLSYKPHEIQWEEVAAEAATGKMFITPTCDKEGRPVILMRPRNENTKESEAQTRHLIFNLEWASRIADQMGTGKMTWLLDFPGYTLRNAPSVRTSISTTSTLQNHYPERLGLAVCYLAPTLFSMTWSAVGPFLDPVTRAKIQFVYKKDEKVEMAKHFDMSQMEACVGGDIQGSWFNVEDYGKRMAKLHAEYVADIAQYTKVAGDSPAAAPAPAVAAEDKEEQA